MMQFAWPLLTRRMAYTVCALLDLSWFDKKVIKHQIIGANWSILYIDDFLANNRLQLMFLRSLTKWNLSFRIWQTFHELMRLLDFYALKKEEEMASSPRLHHSLQLSITLTSSTDVKLVNVDFQAYGISDTKISNLSLHVVCSPLSRIETHRCFPVKSCHCHLDSMSVIYTWLRWRAFLHFCRTYLRVQGPVRLCITSDLLLQICCLTDLPPAIDRVNTAVCQCLHVRGSTSDAAVQ